MGAVLPCFLHIAVCWDILLHNVAAVCHCFGGSSGMSAFFCPTAWNHAQKDTNIRSYCCENLKSHLRLSQTYIREL